MAEVHEEEFESRYEATSAVLIVIALQTALAGVSLANGWTLSDLPGWVWLVPVSGSCRWFQRPRCCWCSPGLCRAIVSSRWGIVEPWRSCSSA